MASLLLEVLFLKQSQTQPSKNLQVSQNLREGATTPSGKPLYCLPIFLNSCKPMLLLLLLFCFFGGLEGGLKSTSLTIFPSRLGSCEYRPSKSLTKTGGEKRWGTSPTSPPRRKRHVGRDRPTFLSHADTDESLTAPLCGMPLKASVITQ